MELHLRHTQTTVKSAFAPHALELFCVPCKVSRMRVRLEEMRLAKDLRLEDLASKLGVSISTIQRWEKHTMSIPSFRLPMIAEAYECRIGDIFEDEDAPEPPADGDKAVVFEMWEYAPIELRSRVRAAFELHRDLADKKT